MKTYFLIGWLLIPVGAAAYHFGPGQQQVLLDDAVQLLRTADGFAAKEQWQQAVAWYDKALVALPSSKQQQRRRARLEKAKAMMMTGQLPDAYLELEALNADLAAEQSGQNDADSAFAREAQEALANAQYYATWSLRLEGQPQEMWEPIIESSRQSYRLLAEEARRRNDEAETSRQSENVESAIRLARVDLGQLQALPIPVQCECSGSCKGCCKGKGKGKGQAKSKPTDSRSAGLGAVADGQGS